MYFCCDLKRLKGLWDPQAAHFLRGANPIISSMEGQSKAVLGLEKEEWNCLAYGWRYLVKVQKYEHLGQRNTICGLIS